MGDGDSSSGSNSSSNYEHDPNVIDEFIFDLKMILVKDLYACDAKWSLFVAAASSYRYDIQLKPFPQIQNLYNKDSNKFDIERLNEIINKTTSLQNVLYDAIDKKYENISPNVIDLLHWVLIGAKDYNLRTTSDEEKDILLKKYLKRNDPKPTYIFEICPPKNCPKEEKFLVHKDKCNCTYYGFYGDKIDKFYSILHKGLNNNNNDNDDDDDDTNNPNEKILLTNDLLAILKKNPPGATWGGSRCGPLVTCVALCEYIQIPEYCTINNERNDHYLITNNLQKIVEIKNSEIIRARYLLFYVKPIQIQRITTALINWVNEHRCFLAICCYATLLATVSFSNNAGGRYLRHLISKQFTETYAAIKQYFAK